MLKDIDSDEYLDLEDYIEMLSEDIDALEEQDLERQNIEMTETTLEEPDPEELNVSTISISMLDKDLKIYLTEIDRPVRTFKYDSSIISGKVLKQLDNERYIFAVAPDFKAKMIKVSKLNK